MKSMLHLLFLIFFMCSALFGAGTFNWDIDTYQEFNKGKLTKIKLNEDSILTLSPSFEKITSPDAVFIWDIKEDSKGNIYLATGNNGIIYKIDKQGKSSVFFRTSSIAAFRLLIDENDTIYASTMTKGLIYKINPQGEGSVFSVFSQEYIWDMKFYKKNILIASGTPGSLYELNLKTKEMKELTLTREMHITCLDIDDQNNIYFGTSDKGAVYKYSDQGKLTLIYQAGEKEIHSLVVDKKTRVIYAGTADKEYALINYKPDVKLDNQQKMDDKDKKSFDEYKDFMKFKLPANFIYEIKENEYVNKIIESKDSTFLSMILDNGALYIGSGDTGIIYTYKNNKVEKLAQLDEQQILCFYKLANKVIMFGTGNQGNLYRLEQNYAEKGSYVSDIYDAQGWAFWGNISWDEKKENGTEITIQTRSGNDEDIDDTWSDWSAPLNNSEGSPVTSPDGRFLQFKINFTTKDKEKTPALFSMRIPYLIKNRRPEVLGIKFMEKDYSEKAKGGADVPQPVYKKTTLKNYEVKIQWDVKDDDKDELQYKLYFTLRSEEKWILFKDQLKENYYVFDTRLLPDGPYLFKVEADDIPSNSPATRLIGEKISPPVMNDNTPPQITIDHKKTGNIYKISGMVKDALSSISAISYSVDAQNWTSIFPSDKLFDSTRENFEFDYKFAGGGIIIIRAEDDSGNTATSYIRIKE